MVERAGSAPIQTYPTIYGRGSVVKDDLLGQQQMGSVGRRPALRASQSSTFAAYPSNEEARHPLHHHQQQQQQGVNSYSQAQPLRAPPPLQQSWTPHGPPPIASTSTHYHDPYAMAPLPPLQIHAAHQYPMHYSHSNGPLSAPLYPTTSDAEYYRSSLPLDVDARASLAHTLQRPASTSALLPQPYAHASAPTMQSSLSHYATRRQASPVSHSRSRSNSITRLRSPVRNVVAGAGAESTEDAAGVLLALKMASPASSIRHSPPPPSSASRQRRDWGEEDDDEEEDDEDDEDKQGGPGDLSLESGEASFSFSAGDTTIRPDGEEEEEEEGLEGLEDRSPPSSSSALSASESNNWPHSRPVASTSSAHLAVAAVSPRKRAASNSPESSGSPQHARAGGLASARKGRGMSFGQYASLTATPTPGMRIAMESSPVVGGRGEDGGDLEKVGGQEGDLEEDDEEDEEGLGSSERRRRRSVRSRRGTNDGSPSRKARNKPSSGALGTSSSSSGRRSSRDRSDHSSSSAAHRHSHYPPPTRRLEPALPLHHHHPVGLSSDLGGFNLSSSSEDHHIPSSSSRHEGDMPPPHPTSSSILSTPAGPSSKRSNGAGPTTAGGGSGTTQHDYYRPFSSVAPSSEAAARMQPFTYPLSTHHHGLSSPPSGYLFSSPAHPGISKQLGLTAQPGPGVFIAAGQAGETPGRTVGAGVGEDGDRRRWSLGSSEVGAAGKGRRGSEEEEEEE